MKLRIVDLHPVCLLPLQRRSVKQDCMLPVTTSRLLPGLCCLPCFSGLGSIKQVLVPFEYCNVHRVKVAQQLSETLIYSRG